MGFRENLQRLRATRTMTQSELAMLVGVSRQSVAKWESEKSYPEMDKLIKLCELFDCTLDDLVRGDLTGRAPDPARSVPPDAPPVDVCGYDGHMRRRTWQVPAGVAAIMLGLGATSLVAQGVASVGGLQGALGFATCLAGVVAGLAFLVPAGIEHRAFRREHPYVEDFYAAVQKAEARRWKARGVVGGIALILVGLVAPAALNALGASWASAFGFWAFVAAGTAFIIFGVMTARRTDVARYNRTAARAEAAPDASPAPTTPEAAPTPEVPVPADAAAPIAPDAPAPAAPCAPAGREPRHD